MAAEPNDLIAGIVDCGLPLGPLDTHRDTTWKRSRHSKLTHFDPNCDVEATALRSLPPRRIAGIRRNNLCATCGDTWPDDTAEKTLGHRWEALAALIAFAANMGVRFATNGALRRRGPIVFERTARAIQRLERLEQTARTAMVDIDTDDDLHRYAEKLYRFARRFTRIVLAGDELREQLRDWILSNRGECVTDRCPALRAASGKDNNAYRTLLALLNAEWVDLVNEDAAGRHWKIGDLFYSEVGGNPERIDQLPHTWAQNPDDFASFAEFTTVEWCRYVDTLIGALVAGWEQRLLELTDPTRWSIIGWTHTGAELGHLEHFDVHIAPTGEIRTALVPYGVAEKLSRRVTNPGIGKAPADLDDVDLLETIAGLWDGDPAMFADVVSSARLLHRNAA